MTSTDTLRCELLATMMRSYFLRLSLSQHFLLLSFPILLAGTLFIGQFLTPIVLGAAAAGLGSLGFALGALGIACAVALLAVLVRGPRTVPVNH